MSGPCSLQFIDVGESTYRSHLGIVLCWLWVACCLKIGQDVVAITWACWVLLRSVENDGNDGYQKATSPATDMAFLFAPTLVRALGRIQGSLDPLCIILCRTWPAFLEKVAWSGDDIRVGRLASP